MSSIVEIGSWKGRSTHALLSGCPSVVHIVDHFKGCQMPHALWTAKLASQVDIHAEFMQNVGHFPNLVVHRMKSLEAIPLFADGSIDMVFIDGEHTYEEVKADILAWLPKATKLICGHDYSPFYDGLIKAVDEIFGPVNHVSTIWYKVIERKALFPYGVIAPSTIPDIADRIMDEYFQIMKKLEIRTCLAFGLCLGIVRDAGYIDGDNDLDFVAIINDDSRDILVNAMTENGFNEGKTYAGEIIRNIHFYKDGILVDVFFRRPGKFYTSFDEVKHKGKIYPIPHPVEEYLSTCYSNWKIKENQKTQYYD